MSSRDGDNCPKVTGTAAAPRIQPLITYSSTAQYSGCSIVMGGYFSAVPEGLPGETRPLLKKQVSFHDDEQDTEDEDHQEETSEGS